MHTHQCTHIIMVDCTFIAVSSFSCCSAILFSCARDSKDNNFMELCLLHCGMHYTYCTSVLLHIISSNLGTSSHFLLSFLSPPSACLLPSHSLLSVAYVKKKKSISYCCMRKKYGSGGIRTHAIEMTGALNQRLRPLGHATPLANFRSGQQ